jgi:hypothetical protein
MPARELLPVSTVALASHRAPETWYITDLGERIANDEARLLERFLDYCPELHRFSIGEVYRLLVGARRAIANSQAAAVDLPAAPVTQWNPDNAGDAFALP